MPVDDFPTDRSSEFVALVVQRLWQTNQASFSCALQPSSANLLDGQDLATMGILNGCPCAEKNRFSFQQQPGPYLSAWKMWN